MRGRERGVNITEDTAERMRRLLLKDAQSGGRRRPPQAPPSGSPWPDFLLATLNEDLLSGSSADCTLHFGGATPGTFDAEVDSTIYWTRGTIDGKKIASGSTVGAVWYGSFYHVFGSLDACPVDS